MNLEEILEKATPRPWEYGELLADGVIIRHGGAYEIRTPEFDVAAQMPSRGPIRRVEDAVLITHAVNNFEPWLATFDAIADKLHHAVNGGLKGPGHRERIGDFKIVMRECRDIARGAIRQAEESAPSKEALR